MNASWPSFATVVGIVLTALLPVHVSAETSCHASSGPAMRPLVELYTSEGCDSCPPADRWLSATLADAASPANALAFHVDYWDRLGWKDRFASAAFTERQRQAATANRAGFVYTPQVLLQGHDYSWRAAHAATALRESAGQPAHAVIDLSAAAVSAGVHVRAVAQVAQNALRKDAQLWLAYVDNGLVSDVKAGENRGARLHHDRVVRALVGGAGADAQGGITVGATLPVPAERGRSPAIVAFVQRSGSFDVLQSLALPLTDCPPR
jgi:hypothetical protein